MLKQTLELNGCTVNIIHMWVEPNECAMCGAIGFHSCCVPWYYNPTVEPLNDGGYKSVCNTCHDRYSKWASLAYFVLYLHNLNRS